MIVYSKYGTVNPISNTKFFSARLVGVVLLIVSTSVLIILKLTTWIVALEVLQFKEAKVEGNHLLTSTEIIQLAEFDSLQNIFKMDLDQISNKIEKHPLVKNAKISRLLPSRLVIAITENEPIALLNKATLIPIDENGQEFADLRIELLHDYPIISNLKNTSVQNELTTELDIILDFLKEIKQHNFTLYSEISEISFSTNYGIYFYLTQGTIPVFVGEQNYLTKSANFLEVLNLIEQENKLSKIEYFDLRFKGQVIVKDANKS